MPSRLTSTMTNHELSVSYCTEFRGGTRYPKLRNALDVSVSSVFRALPRSPSTLGFAGFISVV